MGSGLAISGGHILALVSRVCLPSPTIRVPVLPRLQPFYWTALMARSKLATDAPQLQDVLDALDDPDCRTIIEHLEEPMTAGELADICNIPLSTMYRKLGLLSDASLLEEQIEIRTNGQNITHYTLAFDEVRIVLDDDRSIGVAIKRRPEMPEERLSRLWSEVRKET